MESVEVCFQGTGVTGLDKPVEAALGSLAKKAAREEDNKGAYFKSAVFSSRRATGFCENDVQSHGKNGNGINNLNTGYMTTIQKILENTTLNPRS